MMIPVSNCCMNQNIRLKKFQKETASNRDMFSGYGSWID